MSLATPDPRDRSISEILAKCESSMVQKNFEEAINGCRAVLNIAPDNQRARELMDEAQSRLEAELFTKENLKKAQEYFKMRDFQKCMNECQKIQLLDSDNLAASDLLAQAQKKLEAEPFVQNFVSSGRSLFDSGLYSEAIAQWEKVRAIDPDYPDLDRLINNARVKMTGVSDSFSQEPSPVVGAMFDMGPQVEDTGEGFGFVSDQERIRQLLEEGDRLYNNEQFQGAIEVWSEIFMLDVSHPEALQRIETARSGLSDQRVKVKDLLKSAQQAYEQGNVAEALELFKKVKSIDPENSEANKYLQLMDHGDKEPISLEQLIAQGEQAESRGQFREAAQYFSQALAIDTENASLADRIKSLNLQAKKQEQSKVLMGNARAFAAEGKIDSARHTLGKVLETDPNNQEALDLLRELKETATTTGPAVAAMPRTAAPAIRRGLPVSPALLIGIVALVVAAAGYFFFFSSDEPQQANTPIPKPVAKRPTPAPAPVTNTQTPESPSGYKGRDFETENPAVAKLLREADFYLHEKHYPEATQKAEAALALEPTNKDAISIRLQANQAVQDEQASEKQILEDAESYFAYSDFAGAVRLYEKYLDTHPESKPQILPQIIKCQYNLGVIAIREWRCDIAADYFRQVLFIDETDQLSKDALSIARRCQRSGTSDIEVRKSVALMEMRR